MPLCWALYMPSLISTLQCYMPCFNDLVIDGALQSQPAGHFHSSVWDFRFLGGLERPNSNVVGPIYYEGQYCCDWTREPYERQGSAD